MVIVLDRHRRPAGFTTEKHLRKLCESRRALVIRTYPTVAVLKDHDIRDMQGLQSYRIKIDPGAKHTGIAIVCNETDAVCLYLQIEHRGEAVKKALDTRRGVRRNRRSRETGYRRPGFEKGKYVSGRGKAWLPPSVKSTADNIISWVDRLRRWINITECSFEAVRFDTQLMDDPDIEGVQYQHGELAGYEIREYLLDKYGHTCQYCDGVSGDRILQWEHIMPRSRGGSDSVKNATLACRSCNQDKGNRTLQEWESAIAARKNSSPLDAARLAGIARIREGRAKVSNRYCAWTGSTRRYTEQALYKRFKEVECASGGRTKYNREQVLHLKKDHHLDALCVGRVPENGYRDLTGGYVLMVRAKGRGNRLRGNTNCCGVITIKYTDNSKTHKGYMTGDIVRAVIPKGKYAGRHTGRITIRHRDTFALKTNAGRFDVNCKYMTILQKSDGYSYSFERRTT